MPQLLLELFSEEIPARMQKRAEEDLARAFGEKLKAAGLEPKAIKTFSSPRRLGLVIEDLPAKAADVNEEKKGPRVGAPGQAIQGFLKSAGLSSIDQAQVVEDKKGAFYVAKIERAGRATATIVQEITPEIVRAFPWPKSMRSASSDLQWVRPLHNVLCLFDGAPVKIEIEGVGAKPETFGHRFLGPGAIKPRDFADYAAKLRDAKVLIDREERKAIILEQAKKLCADKKLELVEDIGLLEEVCGLVEWPVTLRGDMDPAFLDLPGEVIRLSMRTHQKYFAVRDPKSGKLAPHFITVANVEAKDGGKAIAAGNARVLSARLNDARFFWVTDKKTPLYTDERRDKLKKIVFHQKLGSVWDKVERVKALAAELCAATGADVESVQRAAELAKMDLVTETVGEFPELQGQVGRQLYALEKGANASIAAAIEDHYRPLGPNDRVPEDKVALTLALSDKLDTLAGFWAIDEKPTGSSDPYALRRAALGVIRIVLERGLRIEFNSYHTLDGKAFPDGHHGAARYGRLPDDMSADNIGQSGKLGFALWNHRAVEHGGRLQGSFSRDAAPDLLAFLADRLKVQLRDQGKRHDLVDAVFALGDDDLVRIVARVEALDAFLKTEDGANLLAGYKRAANILAAEEKKGKWSADEAQGQVDASKLAEPAEKALHAALESAVPTARSAVEKEDFASAMKALAGLRAPVDEFFEKVLVNAEDAMLRRNRLLLLSRLREALSAVADFSKIEG
ncbi:glycine--tRNA ligase subunit beta [Vitreimonas flagellata]|uniref:glycine--tRNA ligase subunit beta n=1 Tax=Vitreimonas flagellata TaxID=2560861 RepID=UPI0010752951|nr:glycine--tRNA ligase subunit beta [Vitreimonas flagellata]